MVGKRNTISSNGQSKSTAYEDLLIRTGLQKKTSSSSDLERGGASYNEGNLATRRLRPKIFRFQDIARTALQDKRREDLKKALLHGIDRDGMEKFRKSEDEIKLMKNKGLREFYKKQNGRLDDWLEVDATVMAIADDVLDSMDPDPDRDGHMERTGGLHAVHGNILELLPEGEKQRRAKANKHARWAVNVIVAVNIMLLVGKGLAALSTGSLSLIASLVDSALDLLCTLIIWSTNKIVQWRLRALQMKFPVGRQRLEPLGIVVFSILVIISFLQILSESIEKLAALTGEPEVLSTGAISALVGTIIVKGITGLAFIPIKNPQVQAIAQDCKTDVIFSTLSLLFPYIGGKVDIWWLDPAGAAILSVIIIYAWTKTFFENVMQLSGKAASARTQQKMLYMAYRFAPVVQGFKNVTAYHCGDRVWVEYDILLPEDTNLSMSHDIAGTLQYCAEGLDEVDRAFVSTDYSSSGPSGHASP